MIVEFLIGTYRTIRMWIFM